MNFTINEPTYWPNTCPVCLKYDCEIICKDCRMVSYCSPSHRSIDRRNHLLICKYLQCFPLPISNCKSEKTNLALYTKKLLVDLEDLHCEERYFRNLVNIVAFPNLCIECFSSENVYYCKNCRAVGFCSFKHEMRYMPKHLMYCELLKITFLADKYIRSYCIEEFNFDHKELNEFSDEKAMLDFIIKTCKLKHAKLKGVHIVDDLTEENTMLCSGLWIRSQLSLMFSICSALREIDISTVDYKPTVVVIASDLTEMKLSPELFNTVVSCCNKNIKRIDVHVTDIPTKAPLNVTRDHCKKCIIHYYRTTYDDTPRMRPDLIFCNIVDEVYMMMVFDTYFARFLSLEDVLICLTSTHLVYLNYFFDMVRNYYSDKIQIIDVKQNPFRDYRPQRNYFHIMGTPIKYNYAYCMFFKTNKSKK